MLQHIQGGYSGSSYIADIAYVLFGFKRTLEATDVRETVRCLLYNVCTPDEKVSTSSAQLLQHAACKAQILKCCRTINNPVLGVLFLHECLSLLGLLQSTLAFPICSALHQFSVNMVLQAYMDRNMLPGEVPEQANPVNSIGKT